MIVSPTFGVGSLTDFVKAKSEAIRSPKSLLTPRVPDGMTMLLKMSFPCVPPWVPMLSVPSRKAGGWVSVMV